MLKQSQIDELRSLSQQLASKGQEPQPAYGGAVERYHRLAELLDHGPALNDALVERVLLLTGQGRYCESLQLCEDRLATNPKDLRALGIWRQTLGDAHSTLTTLAKSAPESAEFGRTYEKLRLVGYVGSSLHIGAVKHYLACGLIERAVEILVPLAQTAPGALGVAEAVHRASQLTDDVRIHQLQLTFEMEAK